VIHPTGSGIGKHPLAQTVGSELTKEPGSESTFPSQAQTVEPAPAGNAVGDRAWFGLDAASAA
jgi:hypothetical protein